MDKTIDLFTSGVHNLLSSEKIPENAAQDSLNFITRDGKTVLVNGRAALGTEGSTGKITGLHIGYKVDGTAVYYRKAGTAIQYWTGSTWTNIITGLDADDEYTFANYTSIAGAFTYVNGPAAFYKIINSHPTSAFSVYNSSKNFYGKIIIDTGRTFLWDRDTDKTGLYGSYIDAQDSTVYTTVSAEALGVLGSTNYTGTLAFKAGGARRSCFAVSISATVAAGTETFVDDYLGNLTSNFGGTGTINYATGAYDVTFSDTTTGAVTGDYQWEDPSAKGVADFSKTAPRNAGEGFVFPQDEGGDSILTVLIGPDGSYYSMKARSVYQLTLDADDTGATNIVYRKDIGIPFFRAALSTGEGIVFINTANPTKPEFTILRRSKVASVVEPYILFPQFKFANFTYDDACISTYDRWLMVFCKSSSSSPSNDRILMCNLDDKTVDIIGYSGRMSIQDGSNFYVGDSYTTTVYTTFDGFDDLNSVIESYWVSKDTLLDTTNLKKTRKLRIKGNIDPDQAVEVYINLDQGGYELVGTIRGDGTYVNYSESQSIGSSMVGDIEVGGGTGTSIYGFYMEIKLKTSKFRTMRVKFVPTSYGYFDFDLLTYYDTLIFENRVPKAYRSKQNVSLDGTQTDQ